MDTIERIKIARKYRGYSQAEMAALFNIAPPSWGRKEAGKIAGFSPQDFKRFLDKVEIDARWIFGQVDGPIEEYDLRARSVSYVSNEEIFVLMEELKLLKTKDTGEDALARRVQVDASLRNLVQKLIHIPRHLYGKIEGYLDGITGGIENIDD